MNVNNTHKLEFQRFTDITIASELPDSSNAAVQIS